MRRVFAFIALVFVFAALTFPQERVILGFIEQPLREAKIDLRLDGASFALPLGWQANGVGLDGDGFGINLESVYIGLLRTIDIRGCGGSIQGDLDGTDDLEIEFAGIDPSRCLRIGDAHLEGAFSGEAHFIGLRQTGVLSLGHTGFIRLRTDGGILSGRLPTDDSVVGVEIGEWEFGEIDIDLALTEGRLEVRHGHALASDVAFEVLAGKAWEGLRAKPEIEFEFRARPIEQAARAKAIIGILPRAEPDYDGWRRYKISGRVDNLKMIGLR
ncbi:MAG: hypothetical protein ACI8TX_001363 [Hyphomicrobiaceae bacterium]|jgi:hypothetical protein